MSTKPKITEGTYARLKGLIQAPTLNNKIVKVLAYVPQQQRWKIKLLPSKSDNWTTYFGVREKNLDPIIDLTSSPQKSTREQPLECNKENEMEYKRRILFVGWMRETLYSTNRINAIPIDMMNLCYTIFTNLIIPSDFNVGDIVRLRNEKIAIIKWKGALNNTHEEYFGVELIFPSNTDSNNNGSFENTEYFQCQSDHGKFVLFDELMEHLKLKNTVYDPDEINKTAKRIISRAQKKLREIAVLEIKQRNGAVLHPNQIGKINGKSQRQEKLLLLKIGMWKALISNVNNKKMSQIEKEKYIIQQMIKMRDHGKEHMLDNRQYFIKQY